ncbi:hypothetical protein [Desulfitobacterium metallireducens]|uniref:Vitamin B12 dependent methionine synthase n=1 Tax=Desulfitobacterium metallireducens DSM 15288 TaxID=871968 RepID=W0EHJ1_9FIRM|nr:hypothetical protein [Desulfitobacterium metallireducens]AHF08546.1 hypothetical protein DESME_08550 [Desulfitobacterium metallireducens DSM 15288]
MHKRRINFLPQDLIHDQQQVRRYLAPFLSKNNTDEFSKDTYSQCLQVFNQEIRPKATLLFTEINPNTKRLESNEGLILLPYKHPLFNKAKYAALFSVTLGSMIDDWTLEFFKAKDYMSGYMIEAIGLLALEEAEKKIRNEFQVEISEEYTPHKTLSHTLSPGCQGIPIEAQNELYQVSEAYAIGITLQRDLSLRPLKSLTGIILAGQDLPAFQEDQCLYCNKKRDCLYCSSLIETNKL